MQIKLDVVGLNAAHKQTPQLKLRFPSEKKLLFKVDWNLKYLSVLYIINNWFIVIIVISEVRKWFWNKRRIGSSETVIDAAEENPPSLARVFQALARINPFSPDINMHILHTVLHLFLIALQKKLSNVKTSSWPVITAYHFILSLDLPFWFGSDIVGIILMLVTKST